MKLSEHDSNFPLTTLPLNAILTFYFSQKKEIP